MADTSTLEVAGEKRTFGSALADFLYPRPAKRTVGGIFKWWERRRLAFNAIIGTAGAAMVSVDALADWLQGSPETEAVILLGGILIWGNLCYTLGPLVETLAHKLWGREVLPLGPHLFRAGLIFSAGLISIPLILNGFRLAFLVLRGILGGFL